MFKDRVRRQRRGHFDIYLRRFHGSARALSYVRRAARL